MNPYRPSHGQFDDRDEYDVLEADEPERIESEFELLNRKFEHATRAAFFLGSVVGLSAAVLLFIAFLITHK
jgi:hypothetical protein